MTRQEQQTFLDAAAKFWRDIHSYLFRITNDEDLAAELLKETFENAYKAYGRVAKRSPTTQRNWLLKIATALATRKVPKGQRLTFQMLDDLIHSDPTRTTQIQGLSAPERQDLTWNLQQDCLTAVLSCLSRGERQAFTLVSLSGLDTAQAAAVLELSESALRVRLSRATQKVAGYLAPRCSLIDPSNPCKCNSRLGVALGKGFVRPHTRRRSSQQIKIPETRPEGDVLRLYSALPAPDPPDDFLQELEKVVASGAWDAAAKQEDR